MKIFKGAVISDKMQKAVIVLIKTTYRHPKYGKLLNRTTKIHAQNLLGAKVGDIVTINEIKPISKTINFSVKEIVKRKVENEALVKKDDHDLESKKILKGKNKTKKKRKTTK